MSIKNNGKYNGLPENPAKEAGVPGPGSTKKPAKEKK